MSEPTLNAASSLTGREDWGVCNESVPVAMQEQHNLDVDTRFEREVMIFISPIYRAALHLTGNAPGAEQLVLETFARAYVSFSLLPAGVNHEAWLCSLLATACREYRLADVKTDGPAEAPL
ncbi:hypothetical protein ABZ312_44735 [Streptomyces sp. NPDC006207]